jgi:putative transposase
VDFVRSWADKTEIPACCFLPWIGIGTSKFHDCKARKGSVNEHNAWVPRDHWLLDEEKEAIRVFARQHPLEGYRRQTFMMLDSDIVACSPASVYRVLQAAGLLAGSSPAPTKKGTGFVQPLRPHEHGHVDVSYLNIAGTFFFLCSILDGCSRRDRPLGNPRENGGKGRGNQHPTGPREVPRPHAADHLRQRAAIHRQGFGRSSSASAG